MLPFDQLKCHNSAIFCGAGISWNSGLPLAGELVSSVLDELFMGDKRVDANPVETSGMPFEVFMETISENVNIFEILDLFSGGIINSNHQWIAKLARIGYVKTILTTNFDLLLEQALEYEGLVRDRDFRVYYNDASFSDVDFGDDELIYVLKIHGSIEDKSSVRATLKGVADKSLSKGRRYVLDHVFCKGKHDKVFVLGYSCSDAFDINPYIKSMAGIGKEVIFVDHKYGGVAEVKEISAMRTNNLFVRFDGVWIRCNTDDFVQRLWLNHEDIFGESYAFSRHEPEWKNSIVQWSRRLDERSFCLKPTLKGALFKKISSFRKAILFYKDAVRFSGENSNENCLAKCYANIGDCCEALGEINEALIFYNKALSIFEKHLNSKGLIQCYVGLGNISHTRAEFQDAISYNQKALRLMQGPTLKAERSKCHSNIGNAYRNLGEYRQAEKSLLRALEIAEATGYKEMESICNTNIGSLYFYMKRWKKAVSYYENSMNIKKMIGDGAGIANCLTGIGICYRNMGRLDDSIKYHRESIEIAEEAGDEYLKSKCYTNLGNVYTDLGRFDEAIQCHNHAYDISNSKGYGASKAIALVNLGIAELGLNNYPSALDVLLNAQKILENQNQSDHLQEVRRLINQVQSKIADGSD